MMNVLWRKSPTFPSQPFIKRLPLFMQKVFPLLFRLHRRFTLCPFLPGLPPGITCLLLSFRPCFLPTQPLLRAQAQVVSG